ncbi:MAG: hypothetical protein KBD16_02475 [Candidatus Pacebacteria bacterium]|nr:hypothetical protein [Candidatus Paceibacterota bacterium]
MQYKEYKQHLEQELETLNWVIDEKILRGLSYKSEARRHLDLIKQARRERRRPLFTRLMSAMALF